MLLHCRLHQEQLTVLHPFHRPMQLMPPLRVLLFYLALIMLIRADQMRDLQKIGWQQHQRPLLPKLQSNQPKTNAIEQQLPFDQFQDPLQLLSTYAQKDLSKNFVGNNLLLKNKKLLLIYKSFFSFFKSPYLFNSILKIAF